MLSFDIRALESQAIQVSSDLPSNDSVWDAEDPRPEEGVHVEGRLSVAGEDRFYFSGHISGTVKLSCRRCLVDVTEKVEDDINVIFSPTGDPATEDDPDVFFYNAGDYMLDIRPAIREIWLLSVPSFVQCRPDCKGLCPQCGIDLNTGTCDCVPVQTDSRWDALRDS